MNYRRLGNSGLKVSALSLGGWTTFGESLTDPRLARDIIVKAYDSGINFFDIADIYAKGEAERLMGSILKLFPRHTLVISSKAYWPMSDDVNDRGLSRKHIMESVEKSLQRIGTDYLDLYFCHRFDEETPLEETVRAMDDLVHQGKILYWGTSEWTGAQIQAAIDLCERHNLYKPQVEQPQYNLLVRRKVEQDVLPVAERHGMGLVVWSPLASGLLTGKYDEALPEDSRLARIDWLRDNWYKGEMIAAVRALKPVADALGLTRAQLAIAWTLRQPGVSSAITGATRPAQLEETLKAVDVTLDAETLARIDQIFAPVVQ
jgi:voltage-dependent potassium channel beta subunit